MCYDESVCQRQANINDNCEKITATKEGNLQEVGKRDTKKGRHEEKGVLQRIGKEGGG